MKLKTSLLLAILFVANGQQDNNVKRHLRSAQQHRKLDVTNGGTPSACGIPKFVGDWESATEYPIPVAESQGGMIGDNFLVVSGFHEPDGGYDASTEWSWKLDTKDPNANWTPVDSIPVPEGVTHGALVIVGTKYYQCGGYLGGHPGPHIPDCIVYDDTKPPGQQWSTLPHLPAGRAGGGMVYDTLSNSLIFSGGAERPKGGNYEDYRHTWKLDLGNIAAGWSADFALPDLPFESNHMSSATVTDSTGKERHFFLGGQMGEKEYTGNIDDNYEFDAINERWIKRADMPFTRGHASSSTRAFGCGFLIMAGSTNEFGKTADVSWYNVETDSWTSIGDLPNAINTPVCDISPNGYLYCESGWANAKFSHRRKIILEQAPVPPTPSPPISSPSPVPNATTTTTSTVPSTAPSSAMPSSQSTDASSGYTPKATTVSVMVFTVLGSAITGFMGF